jgi:serine/threonine protein phosphatase PrpC
VEQIIAGEVEQFDRSFLAEMRSMGSKDDGSTLCAVIMKGDKMVVVNVGDSRAALIRAGTLSRLTKDHKPEDPIEKVGMLSALCLLIVPYRLAVQSTITMDKSRSGRPRAARSLLCALASSLIHGGVTNLCRV